MRIGCQAALGSIEITFNGGSAESHLVEIDVINLVITRCTGKVAQISNGIGLSLGVRPVLEIEIAEELDGIVNAEFQPAMCTIQGCILADCPVVLVVL